MVYLLYFLFFVSCVVLIASVLLQPGKTDAGALFTSNISSTAFQPRGATTILSKLTIGAATVFMLSALLLAMPALTGNLSVLQTTADASSETTPSLDANSNANVDANANVNVDPNANNAVNTNVSANSNISATSNVQATVQTNANTVPANANAQPANK